MSETLLMILTVVGVLQVFYVIHLLNMLVSGLERLDRRMEEVSREGQPDVEAALMERLGETLGRRYSSPRGGA